MGRIVKKDSRAPKLPDPQVHPGDAEVDLPRRRGGPLVYEPQLVSEGPPRRRFWDYPQPDLIADQHERNLEAIDTGQEAFELGERLVRFTRRHPQGQRIDKHGIPTLRRVHDVVEVPDLEGAPFGGPAVPVKSHAPAQVFIISNDSRCHVKNAVPPDLGGQTLGEGALAAPGAAEDEGVDGYNSSLRAESSRSFSASPLTATRKNPAPRPINGSQPRTSRPRRASRPASASGPRTIRKLAAPG